MTNFIAHLQSATVSIGKKAHLHFVKKLNES